MDFSSLFDPQAASKAFAGGVLAALVAVGAHYGFNPSATTVTAAGVILTAAVGYIIGHVGVWLAPKNKPKI